MNLAKMTTSHCFKLTYISSGELRFQNDDDFIDRLSRRYTTFFLVLFGLVVSTKQYVGEPMACWVPAHFTPAHEEYTNKVCWVSNTYYLPFEVCNCNPKSNFITIWSNIRKDTYSQNDNIIITFTFCIRLTVRDALPIHYLSRLFS